ncbi:hypothetical protein CMUS01_14113 [Colletotrichum musicola]|uniref:Uncharacterized protein n=1 Tax=Colletotrichum musicola TaxID=2175873 RepID=A0A8H6J6M6_9PEZI|nr:hypothetical protein CMUS01_14113 [Colletotrichum musicola]
MSLLLFLSLRRTSGRLFRRAYRPLPLCELFRAGHDSICSAHHRGPPRTSAGLVDGIIKVSSSRPTVAIRTALWLAARVRGPHPRWRQLGPAPASSVAPAPDPVCGGSGDGSSTKYRYAECPSAAVQVRTTTDFSDIRDYG